MNKTWIILGKTGKHHPVYYLEKQENTILYIFIYEFVPVIKFKGL